MIVAFFFIMFLPKYTYKNVNERISDSGDDDRKQAAVLVDNSIINSDDKGDDSCVSEANAFFDQMYSSANSTNDLLKNKKALSDLLMKQKMLIEKAITENNNLKEKMEKGTKKVKKRKPSTEANLPGLFISSNCISYDCTSQKKLHLPRYHRLGSSVESNIIKVKLNDDSNDCFYIMKNIPFNIMTQLSVSIKTDKIHANMSGVQGCNQKSVFTDRSKYIMFDPSDGKDWMSAPIVKRNNKHFGIAAWEKFLIDSITTNLNHEDENFEYHKPGVVLTTFPQHQELHLDDEDVYDNKKKKGVVTYIYHVPLCSEGLQMRVAELKLEGSKVILKEKMIHIDYGDALILPPNIPHSGHYGNRGNLRLHGIISTHHWTGSHLLKLSGIIDGMFGKGTHDTVPLENVSDHIINDLCPLCFRSIVNQKRVDHDKKCRFKSGKDIGAKQCKSIFV